ncbi:MAG TPA: 2'-5' RNA ligase family protein [Acetobacteraceae bacterium]|nr:2'-5' RNA ligase family protein [Acetobacteraceae bacterium]
MPLAVTLRLDAAGSARVDAMRAALADGEASIHPPHITLAVFTDDVDAAALADDLSKAVAAWTPMRLTFVGLGVFPGEPAVLWLAPAPTIALLDRHARVNRLRSATAAHPHYRSDVWVPHLTLAEDLTLDGAADAVRTSSADWEPFAADLDRVELVRFAPASVLWCHRLS